MATVLDPRVTALMTEFNANRDTAFAMTAAQAAGVNEAPGLINDPVLGSGAPSLAALNLAWQYYFRANFEVTGHQKMLMMQQAMDLNRAKGFVTSLRTRVSVQDGPVFNLNPVA